MWRMLNRDASTFPNHHPGLPKAWGSHLDEKQSLIPLFPQQDAAGEHKNMCMSNRMPSGFGETPLYKKWGLHLLLLCSPPLARDFWNMKDRWPIDCRGFQDENIIYWRQSIEFKQSERKWNYLRPLVDDWHRALQIETRQCHWFSLPSWFHSAQLLPLVTQQQTNIHISTYPYLKNDHFIQVQKQCASPTT